MNNPSEDRDGSDIEGQECDEAGAHCVVLRPMPAVMAGCADDKGKGEKMPRAERHWM